MERIKIKESELTSPEFSNVIGLKEMPEFQVASYKSYEENAREAVWNFLLQWAGRNHIPLQETRFFGFPNPIHPICSRVYGYEGWIVLSEPISTNRCGPIEYKTIPKGLYAVTRDQHDRNGELRQSLEKWIFLQNLEFGHSVCLENYSFRTYRYNTEEYTAYCMPVHPHQKEESGTVIDMEPMSAAVHICDGDSGNIARAVDWYVNEWAYAHWRDEDYHNYRIFVTSTVEYQELLIKYPDGCKIMETGMKKRMIGGKYLSFNMSALVLRRNIPRYLKKMICDGYQYDTDRFFFEEHFKHCNDYSRMMMGRIYFPIKSG